MFNFFGCSYSTDEQEVEDVSHYKEECNRAELTEKIITLKPRLKGELEELSLGELGEIYEELQAKREQKIKDRLKEMDNNEQLEKEDMYHHHDPHPPQPPIYERPEPVPDPPIEEN